MDIVYKNAKFIPSVDNVIVDYTYEGNSRNLQTYWLMLLKELKINHLYTFEINLVERFVRHSGKYEWIEEKVSLQLKKYVN